MPKEIKVYEADDKKIFKTEKGAENHNKKLAVKKVIKDLSMSEEEIGEKLKEISERVSLIDILLHHEPNWTKWYIGHIRLINADLFKTPLKTTYYLMEYKTWNGLKEDVLFIEKGIDFADPELHCNSPELSIHERFKVVRVEEKNSITRNVYYDFKYDWKERMKMKLEDSVNLSSSEINDLISNFSEVHREEGENRRWSKSVLSVIDIDGDLYAIEWEEGLTENQENEFCNQPYPVTLKTEEIVIKQTTVVKK